LRQENDIHKYIKRFLSYCEYCKLSPKTIDKHFFNFKELLVGLVKKQITKKSNILISSVLYKSKSPRQNGDFQLK